MHDFFLNLLKQTKSKMSVFKRRSHIYFVVFVALIILQCEGRERFYRPDLPEQLCAVGLIDIDDTLSYDEFCQYCWFPYGDTMVSLKRIYFEKSFQSDFTNGSTDSLSEFIFRISDEKEDIFVYQNVPPIRNPIVEIPADLKFETGRKYFFNANEKETPDISVECIVPELPPTPSLVSLKTGIAILDLPKEGCFYHTILGWSRDSTYSRRFAEIEFSFTNINSDSYYAIFLIGTPSYEMDWGPRWPNPNFMNYNVLETNTDGFFYTFKGVVTMQHLCFEFPQYQWGIEFEYDRLNAYFIDGNRIPGGNCTTKIFVQWDNVKYIPSFIEYFRVRILSIPKEAYLFYKSLNTYKMERDDPFGELININGNVVGGNGVIALCRSRDLIVYTGQTGGMYDPYF